MAAGKRTATCETCGEGFACAARGKIPKVCPTCKAAPAEGDTAALPPAPYVVTIGQLTIHCASIGALNTLIQEWGGTE